MKLLIITLLMSCVFTVAHAQSIVLEAQKENTTVEARIVNGKIYFKLSCLNEMENSTYVLSKRDSKGNEQFIGSKKGFKNSINQVISYSFKDENPGNVPAKYYLVRLTEEGEVISSWAYSGKTGVFASKL